MQPEARPRSLPWILLPLLAAPALALQEPGSPSSSGSSGSWTHFRGPNGSGVAECGPLPAELGPERNLRWRVPLPPGRSSPVLWGERIFLTGLETGLEGEQLVTLGVDRNTGEVLWKRGLERPRKTRCDPRNGPASPTAAVDGERVVVFFQDYGLAAYDHDGEELWRAPLGPFDNLYGMGASPILAGGLAGGLALLACDQNTGSFLVAFDAGSGEQRWRAERPWAKSGHCTPVLFHPEGGAPQVILPGSFTLDAYDLASGKRVWWVGGLSFEMKSVPVLYEGVVYVNGYGSPFNQPGNQIEVPPFEEVLAERDADGNGSIGVAEMPPTRARAWFPMMDLDGDEGLDGEEWDYLRRALASQNGLLAIAAGGQGERTEQALRWSWRRAVPQLPSPLIYRGVLYLLADSGGLLTTFDPVSGELLERGRIPDGAGDYYASPVAGDGKLYLVTTEGRVLVLPAGGGLEPLGVGELGETCHATPAIAGGALYLRTQEALYCFGVEGD